LKNFNKEGIYKLKNKRNNDHYKIIASRYYIYIQLEKHTLRMTPNFFYFLDKQDLYEQIFSNYSYNLGLEDIYDLILKPLKKLYEIHLLENREARKNKNKDISCNMDFSLENEKNLLTL